MGKIGNNVFRDWNDGDTIRARDYKQEREVIRTAINDSHDRFFELDATNHALNRNNPHRTTSKNLVWESEDWVRATLQNGWVPFDSFAPGAPHFLKDATGTVFIRGGMKDGSLGGSGTPAFTLPEGYRPSVTSFFTVISSGVNNPQYARVRVGSDGSVSVQSTSNGSNDFIALSIAFKTGGTI